jgi:hypothetical protein
MSTALLQRQLDLADARIRELEAERADVLAEQERLRQQRDQLLEVCKEYFSAPGESKKRFAVRGKIFDIIARAEEAPTCN